MISVIIPVYNGEQFVEETYRSIAEAEEQDFEILFVDDGSKDGSAAVIKKLAEKDQRVRYFYKENGGIASARNFGLDQVMGDYVCFVDQDDFPKWDMLSLMKKDIEEHHADIVKAATNQMIDGVEETICSEENCKCISHGEKQFDYYLQTLILRGVSPKPEYEITCSIWSCLFRTEFLRKHQLRFFSFCDYEDDWLFCIQAFKAAERFCLEKKTLYTWRVHRQSESHNRVEKDKYLENFYENHQQMREFLMKEIQNIGLTQAQKDVFERELQKQALLWALSNETGRGIRKHTRQECTQIMKQVVKMEKSKGICKHLNRYPLSISGYGMSGAKRYYHLFRDIFLTFLLLHHMEGAAVLLNQKVLHGRWHI